MTFYIIFAFDHYRYYNYYTLLTTSSVVLSHQVFYDTLPAVTRAVEVNSLLHPLYNNDNDDTTTTTTKDGSNNDDSLTSAQAMAARALLLTPYDPPANPHLPPLSTDPDASEDSKNAIAAANKERQVMVDFFCQFSTLSHTDLSTYIVRPFLSTP